MWKFSSGLFHFCTSWRFTICFFCSKEGLFLELLDVQKCKSPLGNFHMVSTLDWFSQTFKSTYIWVDNRVQTRQNQVHQTWFFILNISKIQVQIDRGRNTITHLRIREISFCVGQKIPCYFRNKNTIVLYLLSTYHKAKGIMWQLYAAMMSWVGQWVELVVY